MSQNPHTPHFADLGRTLAVFPLPGVLLLPQGDLPLNIFEPRYIAMVDDALAADRMIGMGQPRDEEADPSPLYDTGCAGRITAFEETGDGRYLITLTGVARFKLGPEIHEPRGYRRFEVDWTPYSQDLGPPDTVTLDRPRLLEALSRFFRQHGIEANWDAIEQTPDHRLITSLAMVCPFAPSEKQALLEAPGAAERAALLTGLVEMALHDRSDDDGARH